MKCSIEGCESAVRARDWCNLHYLRWLRHGDPSMVHPRHKPERIAEPGYFAVHSRLRSERGPASSHACAECGNPARDWAFDEATGFSTDLSRYRPLCRPCHWACRHDPPDVVGYHATLRSMVT